MSKESKMEPLEKTWLLEIIVAAMLAALLGLWGWTANKVVQVGENVVEDKAELQQEIGEVRVEIAEVRVELGEVKAELGREIAEVNGKLDLLIRGLNISVAPKDSAGAGPSGAKRGGFRVGAGEAATE